MILLRRWGVLLGLLLSVGVNLGVLVVLLRRPAPVPHGPPVLFSPADAEFQEPPPGPEVPGEIPAAELPDARPDPRPVAGERDSLPPLDRAPEGAGVRWSDPPERAPMDSVAEPRFDQMVRALGLTGDRAERFVAVQRRSWEQSRRLRADLHRARSEMGAELLSGRARRPRVEQLAAEMGRSQAELDQAVLDLLLQTQDILTLDEQQRFARFVLTRLQTAGPPGAGPGGRPEGPVRRMLDRRREGAGRPGRLPGGHPPPRRGPGPPPG